MKSFLILVLILSLTVVTLAQVDTSDILNDKLFQLLEESSENTDDLQYYEIIEDLLNNPIEINEVTKTDLLQIPFVSQRDANRIIRFRNNKNGILSYNELKLIKSVDEEIIILIKPFLKFTRTFEIEKKKKNQSILNVRSRLINDIQTREGFKNGNYLGDDYKSYQRIKGIFGNFYFGGLIEKDAGEESYFDNYSGFVQYKSKEFLQNIILGDFNLEFGQGLAMWSPYGFSKGIDAISSPQKKARTLIPHLSSEENIFFRGSALTINYKNFELSAYYSIKNIDATQNDNLEISNFYISGYHRTISEYSHKDVLKGKSFGAVINFNSPDFLNFGLLYFANNYEKTLNFKQSNQLRGENFSFTSIAYKIFYKSLSLSGEASYNGKTIASLNNLFLELTKDIKILASVRYYPNSYFNIYANGFGENGNTQNEIGYYLGLKINSVFGKFNFYYDIFNYPHSSFQNDFPVNGNDFLIHYSKKIAKGVELNIKLKHEDKEVTLINNSQFILGNEKKINYRVSLKYKIDKNIFGKTRIEIVQFSDGSQNENGYLTYQEIKYKFNSISQLVGRIIFFETDSYNSRLYEFENDLRGVLTNLPMFGEGFRWYLLFNIEPITNVKLSLKYAESYKPNLTTISSGNSEIFGNVDNRVSMQIDYNF